MNNNIETRAKLIAMYFPQLHAIPENDEWWGNGFTDWFNVKRAVPKYRDHYQPRVPLNSEYYDQSQENIIRAQVELAKKYGLFGFCHYHYWFDGKQLLETPTNIVLDNPDIDFPFCLSWANETWSRRWDGRKHSILINQTHPPTEESWEKHFQYLVRAWTDHRAIKINEKPVFVIYRPQNIEKISDMIAYWKKRASAYGIPGLFIMAQKSYNFPNRKCIKDFDAIFHFQPFETVVSKDFDASHIHNKKWFRYIRYLPETVQEKLRDIRGFFKNKLTFYDYDLVWENILKERPDKKLITFPGAFVDWDNTARYGDRATIFKGASPERFKYWFSRLVDSVSMKDESERYIFINAWNEWAEGAYLEPDEKYQFQYLEAVREVLQTNK